MVSKCCCHHKMRMSLFAPDWWACVLCDSITATLQRPVVFMEVVCPTRAVYPFHVDFNVHPNLHNFWEQAGKKSRGHTEGFLQKLIACLLWLICKSIFWFKTEGGRIPGRKRRSTDVPSGVSYEPEPQMDCRWRLNLETLIYWKGNDSERTESAPSAMSVCPFLNHTFQYFKE
jgi:hypothetical protein